MIDVHEPQSPYLLPIGPERRALMRSQGVRPCPLDYTDDELDVLDRGPAAAAPSPAPTTIPAERAV